MGSSNDPYVYTVPRTFYKKNQSVFQYDLATFFFGPLCGVLWLTLWHIGFPPLFILLVLSITTVLLIYREDMCFQLLTLWLTRLIVHVFFRDIQSRNAYKIPQEGPVIFVCAPHANQFLDPGVVMEFVPRPISFMIAAKSYRQSIIGDFARGQCSIPVERPQDLATAGKGKVTIQGLTVRGTDTEFTSISPSCSLFLKGEQVKIDQIISNTELTIKQALPAGDLLTPSTYKVAPKIDQHQVFEHVWKALAANQCVGIFPEGGSHDRTEQLPLKAGVAIMALGAAAQHPGLNIKLVAVGLNYFHGHRFRGRAYVEYGDPFNLSQDLVALYQRGGPHKVEACNLLLEQIKDQLKTVTVNAPSWDQLIMLWAVRRLYQPSGVKLPPKLAVVLIRRLSEAYAQVKHMPEVAQVEAEVCSYNHTLRTYGLRDHQVPVTCLSRSAALVKLASRTLRLILIAMLALPGFILNLPILIVTRCVSKKKADEALKASSVKVAAKDVLASWKVLISLSMVPLVFILYPSLAALVGYWLGIPMLHTWGNFAVLQPLMMWAAVRSTETFLDIARSIKPLFFAVTDRKGSQIAEIRQTRTHLKHKIRNLVNTLGPALYGPQFDTIRIFSPSTLTDDPKQATQLNYLENMSIHSGGSLSSQHSGMGDAADESSHQYREEREIKVSPEVLSKLDELAHTAPVPEEYHSTLNAMALAPLEKDDKEEYTRLDSNEHDLKEEEQEPVEHVTKHNYEESNDYEHVTTLPNTEEDVATQ